MWLGAVVMPIYFGIFSFGRLRADGELAKTSRHVMMACAAAIAAAAAAAAAALDKPGPWSISDRLFRMW